MNICNKHKQRGFTLFELLIALTIFAIMGTMAYSGLDSVLNSSHFTQQKADELKELQLAFTIMRRDFSQVVNRQVREPFGNEKPLLAIQSGNLFDSLIDLTRSGWNNPAQQLRSNLQRVSYQLSDNILIRKYSYLLDNMPQTKPIETELLHDIEKVSLRFLDQQKKWQKTWPPLQQATNAPPTLPLAVEVTVEHTVYKEIKQLFAITQ